MRRCAHRPPVSRLIAIRRLACSDSRARSRRPSLVFMTLSRDMRGRVQSTFGPRYPQRIWPMRMRCGWSPTGMRATSRRFAYDSAATASLPLNEVKQYRPSPLFVTQYGRSPCATILYVNVERSTIAA